MKFEFGNNIERHPYRPLPEAEKQGLTEEEIFQKEYGLYTDFVYRREWVDKFKEIYGREPEPRELWWKKYKAVMNTSTKRKRPKYSKLGKQIKKKLIDKRMTACELAGMLGISPQYLNLIIHGERSGEKYAERIREILEIDTAA